MSEQTSVCTHEIRLREYYRDGLYRCWGCQTIIEEAPKSTQINNTPKQTRMTPVERLAQYIKDRYDTNESFEILVQNLREQEKNNIKQAVLYALDEDGHTGDWKLAFAEKYFLDNFVLNTNKNPSK